MSKLDVLVKLAENAINEARDEADETGERFTLWFGDMHSTYYPRHSISKDKALDILRSGDTLTDEMRERIAKVLERDEDSYYQDGWHSSNC